MYVLLFILADLTLCWIIMKNSQIKENPKSHKKNPKSHKKNKKI